MFVCHQASWVSVSCGVLSSFIFGINVPAKLTFDAGVKVFVRGNKKLIIICISLHGWEMNEE